MRMKLSVKSAILAALTIISASQAFAGDPSAKSRALKTQGSGGESGGGGNPRIAMASEADIRALVQELTEHDSGDQYPEVFMNPKVFVLNKSVLSDEEITGLSNSAIGFTRYDGGPRAGKTLVYNIGEEFNSDHSAVQDFDLIKDPALKAALRKMFNTKIDVDYDFIVKNEKAFKRTFERWNPNLRFDKEQYKNLIIRANAYSLNSQLTEFKVQDAPCTPKVKKAGGTKQHKTMQVEDFKLFSPICVSRNMLKLIPELSLEDEVTALVQHEHAHQFGFRTEDIPDKVQDYALGEVATKRLYVRMQIRSFIREAFDTRYMNRSGEQLTDEEFMERWRAQVKTVISLDNDGLENLINLYAKLTRVERNTLKKLYSELISELSNNANHAKTEEEMLVSAAYSKRIADQMIQVIAPKSNVGVRK